MTEDETEKLPAIVAEGKHWFALDKPAGLAVHPGPRTPHSLEEILPLYAPHRPVPQPAHRLDRDTSGCLLVARRTSALRRLSAAFADGAVEKLYWAIVLKPPLADAGRVEAALEKISSKEQGWRIVADKRGKHAVTRWNVLERRGDMALMAFRPETGRTHQIRVHATLLAPDAAIVGDALYGAAHPAGMMLHARELRFPDPDGGAEQQIAMAPLPARFAAAGFSSDGLVDQIP